MRVTNKHNLPAPLVEAAKRQQPKRDYDTIRVTTLIKAPKPAFLKAKHWDKLTVDAVDSIWALFGTGVHKALEEYSNKLNHVETTLVTEFMGIKIQGTIDLMTVNPEDGTIVIQDYKTTTAWASQQEKPEWETQLNVYAWIAKRLGYKIVGLNIVAILRDWSRSEASRDPTYPQAPVRVIPIDLWEDDLVEAYVKSRIEVHSTAHINNDLEDDLPDCTPEERWYRPGKYAVHNTGTPNRALKVFDDGDRAMIFANAYNGKKGTVTTVVSRSGKSSMCWGFCEVREYCDQFKTKVEPTEIDLIILEIKHE